MIRVTHEGVWIDGRELPDVVSVAVRAEAGQMPDVVVTFGPRPQDFELDLSGAADLFRDGKVKMPEACPVCDKRIAGWVETLNGGRTYWPCNHNSRAALAEHSMPTNPPPVRGSQGVVLSLGFAEKLIACLHGRPGSNPTDLGFQLEAALRPPRNRMLHDDPDAGIPASNQPPRG